MLGGLIDRCSRGLPAGSSLTLTLQPAGAKLKLQLLSRTPDQLESLDSDNLSQEQLGPVLSWNTNTGGLQLSQNATRDLLERLGGRLTQRRDQGLTVFFPMQAIVDGCEGPCRKRISHRIICYFPAISALRSPEDSHGINGVNRTASTVHWQHRRPRNSAETEEKYAITWSSNADQAFRLPTGGAAMMNSGENIMYFARKEQCLALGTQLRTKFKPRIEDYKIYRIFPGGDTEYLHPSDGVFPEKVNEGRAMVGHNPRRIGQNTNPANIKFSGRNTFDA